MTSIERNSKDWSEIRSRVDSIANAVFLISGGALSFSISALLNHQNCTTSVPAVIQASVHAWYGLLVSVIAFLLLKSHMVGQAYLLQFHTEFVNRHVVLLNAIGWAIGVLGFLSFSYGFVRIVHAATLAIGA